MHGDSGPYEMVLARVASLERELVEALAQAVRIESINPKYPTGTSRSIQTYAVLAMEWRSV